jgi:hypothetical protein
LYTGNNDAVSIAKWVYKKAGPASRKASCEGLGSRMVDKLNLVYFGDFSGELFELYLKVAESTNDVYSCYHA